MNILVRAYRYSDAYLLRIAAQIIFSLERDINDFNTFGGITIDVIQNIRNLYLTFAGISTNEYYEGLKAIKTEEKNNVREKLNTKIRETMTLVALRFGKSSANYRHFGIGSIANLSDEQVQRSCSNIARCVALYHNDLMEVGVSQSTIDALNSLRNELIAALDAQSFAIHDRDIATEKRIQAGNKLYHELIRYMNVGKVFWKTRNEAKYNDYIMYNESGKVIETEENLTNDIDVGKI
jgi:hypothetical protein